MAGGYGPPLLDFSPLGNLANTFFRAKDQAEERTQKKELRQSLASLGQGKMDYETLGHRMLALGDVSNGIGFLKIAQEEKTRKAQTEADRQAFGLAYGSGSSGSAPSYGTTGGTPRANIDRNTVHVAESEEDVQRLERATGQHLWDEDKDAITRTVYGEASGEGPVGQAAVAGVIANRARQSGMTPADVVTAKGQFEPWSDPAARARMQNLAPESPVYQQIAEAAIPVVTGQAPDPTGGADHFYAPKAQAALGRNAPAWDDGTGQDIGNHRFFRHGYRPQGPVQVAQADVPAPGAQQAQGFVVPGEGGATSPAIANLERALTNPNLSDGARRALQSRLDREYKRLEEANRKTELQRNYEVAVSQGFKGSIVDYQTAIRKAGATTVNNNVGDGSPLRKKLDEKEGERWSTLQEAAVTSGALTQDFQVLDELMKVAPQGPIVGQLAEMFPGVSSAGAAFQSIVTRVAPSLRTPGSGATSDVEYEGMVRSLPRLANRPEANRMIADTMKAKAQINVQRGQIVTDYQNGIIDADQARRQLAELNKVSILSPELKQIIKTSGAASLPGFSGPKQGNAPPVDGAQKAPDGNWYIPDPNRPGKYLKVD